MRLRGVTLALLLSSASALTAQSPPLQPGDSVRVWRRGSAAALQDRVVSITSDSLILRTLPLALADVNQIDVARGTQYNRARLAAFVVAGLLSGTVAGYALGSRDRGAFCDTCIFDRATTTALGANLGAGI